MMQVDHNFHVPLKHWTTGVRFDDNARAQLHGVASMPFVGPHVAVMPDVHLGIGCSVGSVIPTKGAIIPAAVGVDIGCGMVAIRTQLTSYDVSENGKDLLEALEKAVPHGGGKDKAIGAWDKLPWRTEDRWAHDLLPGYEIISEKYPACRADQAPSQLGTLGGGNHFVEVCLDEEDRVWLMLHSGSRGVGNRIGSFFTALARDEMTKLDAQLPNKDLAYLSEGTPSFNDYLYAVWWAQEYAWTSRQIMMAHSLQALRNVVRSPFADGDELDIVSGKVVHGPSSLETAINCHHNYVSHEEHFGQLLYITRKGAVRAELGELGIIPGSMGTGSFIVRGLGNYESFKSCSHGAGRVMSRGEAKKAITLEDHARDTEGVACRKDASVIDESPRAYKDIVAVMAAQADLVEVVHTLKQIVCVKG